MTPISVEHSRKFKKNFFFEIPFINQKVRNMTKKMCGRSSNLDKMAQRWFWTTFGRYTYIARQIRVNPYMPTIQNDRIMKKFFGKVAPKIPRIRMTPKKIFFEKNFFLDPQALVRSPLEANFFAQKNFSQKKYMFYRKKMWGTRIAAQLYPGNAF